MERKDPAKVFATGIGKGQGVPGAPTQPRAMREAQAIREAEAEALRVAKAQMQGSGGGYFSGGGFGRGIPEASPYKVRSPASSLPLLCMQASVVLGYTTKAFLVL